MNRFVITITPDHNGDPGGVAQTTVRVDTSSGKTRITELTVRAADNTGLAQSDLPAVDLDLLVRALAPPAAEPPRLTARPAAEPAETPAAPVRPVATPEPDAPDAPEEPVSATPGGQAADADVSGVQDDAPPSAGPTATAEPRTAEATTAAAAPRKATARKATARPTAKKATTKQATAAKATAGRAGTATVGKATVKKSTTAKAGVKKAAGARSTAAKPSTRAAAKPPVRAARKTAPAATAGQDGTAPSGRPYRRMPEPAEVLAAYAQIGTISGLADAFAVPRHTASAWARRLRQQGHSIGRA